MNKRAVDDYRELLQSRLEELTLMNAQQNSDIHYVKETVSRIETIVKEQNGRVRNNESAIARIQGIGGMLSIVFASFIGWLFKMKG
jgi:ribosomal protein L29